MKKNFHKPTAAGFSLIEVLVATSILMVIVLLISMIFQQSSGAFDEGTRRVRNQTALRNVVGTISRDLSMAVSDIDYPGSMRNKFSGGNSIAFIALTGSGANEVQYITYSYGGGIVTRACTTLKEVGGRWTGTGAAKTTFLNDIPLDEFSFNVVNYDSDLGLPERVDITAYVAETGESTYISGRSAGPDKKFGTNDDIIVGER